MQWCSQDFGGGGDNKIFLNNNFRKKQNPDKFRKVDVPPTPGYTPDQSVTSFMNGPKKISKLFLLNVRKKPFCQVFISKSFWKATHIAISRWSGISRTIATFSCNMYSCNFHLMRRNSFFSLFIQFDERKICDKISETIPSRIQRSVKPLPFEMNSLLLFIKCFFLKARFKSLYSTWALTLHYTSTHKSSEIMISDRKFA